MFTYDKDDVNGDGDDNGDDDASDDPECFTDDSLDSPNII